MHGHLKERIRQFLSTNVPELLLVDQAFVQRLLQTDVSVVSEVIESVASTAQEKKTKTCRDELNPLRKGRRYDSSHLEDGAEARPQ
jgi:hypothetical protein